ncbi:MAG: hypothetical protein Q9165_002565 [Trypethelium subeluteriae]
MVLESEAGPSGQYERHLPEIDNGEDWAFPDKTLRNMQYPKAVDCERLASAIQHGCSYKAMNSYLQSYPKKTVRQKIRKTSREVVPIIFYAAARNSILVAELFLHYGADPNAMKPCYDGYKMPLLAFVIDHGAADSFDTIEMVKALLVWGADPFLLPPSLWFPIKRPDYETLESRSQDRNALTGWCRGRLYTNLQCAVNLSHRYLFQTACILDKPSELERQIAENHNVPGLLQIPYCLIGQRRAAVQIKHRMLQHIEICTSYKTPLVLTFVGPSGHGKSELAHHMTKLLPLDLMHIDIAQMQSTNELLGVAPVYQTMQEENRLINFLIRNNGKRGVVVLDGLEKTTNEARNALVPILRSETYHSLWFKHLTDEAQLQEPLDRLNALLEPEFRQTWSVPFTGCINTFVPFFPFSPDEQLAIVHRCFLDLATTVKKPIEPKKAPKRHIGQCELDILFDGQACESIAYHCYVKELGARSLVQGVAERVEAELYREYVKRGRRMSSHTIKEAVHYWTIDVDPFADDLSIHASGGPRESE